MKIDALGFHPQYNKRQLTEGRTSTPEKMSYGLKSKHDTISLSAEAQCNRVGETADHVAIKRPAMQVRPSMVMGQQERIDQIKMDVQNGTYAVADNLIVDAIIQRSSVLANSRSNAVSVEV